MGFHIKFRSPTLESEYQNIKKHHVGTFYKVLIFVAFMIVVYKSLDIIYYHSMWPFVRMLIIAICLAFLVLYNWKSVKYKNIRTLIPCFALYLNGLFGIKYLMHELHSEGAFYAGHIYGILERIFILYQPQYELKIVFATASIIARLSIFPFQSTENVISQIIIWIICVIVDVWKEKDDRALFKSFYDYREELKKFKHLMVSGLPANILILTRDIKQKLFTNDNFHGTFQGENSLESFRSPKEWLDKMIIEKETLNPASKEALTDEQTEVAMSHIFDKLNEKHLLDDSEKYFSFSVKSQQGASEKVQKIFEIKVFPLKWDHKDALAITLNDVTQQYMNLSLRIADTNKDKMLAMVSHELRTPLNGILGMLSIIEKKIKEKSTDEQMLAYLTVCQNSGKLLLNLVNSILDLGQIRNNKLSLVLTRVNIQEMLEEIFCLFEFQFRAKGLYLKMNITADADQLIITDQNRLKQILINLIGNALKFTYEGGVEVSVTKSEDILGYIQFKVSDTGIGIKDENIKKLFQMYGRLEQQNSQVNSQGVGLGLTISNHLVHILSNKEQEDGIQVESEFGKGTTFSFSVKANLKEDEEPECNIGDTEGREHDDSPTPMVNKNMTSKAFQSSPKADSYVAGTPADAKKKELILDLNSSHKIEENDSFMYKVDFFKGMVSPLNRSSFYPDNEDHIPLNKTKEKGHVLLVDDSPFNIMVAKHLIESLGYSVMTALNGEIAVEMMKNFGQEESPIKTILMDCQMPVMDGYEATTVLKKMMKEGEIPETPIVALSANDTLKDKDRCKEVGMCDHLSKPLNEDNLRKVLGRYCRSMDIRESRIKFKATSPF